MRNHPLGIYEKALAKDLSWPERLVLAKSCGFDFVEMSVDETDERLSRLDWSAAQRTSLVAAMIETGVAIPSMCLSAHRRFPFGSRDDAVRQRAREMRRLAASAWPPARLPRQPPTGTDRQERRFSWGRISCGCSDFEIKLAALTRAVHAQILCRFGSSGG